MTAAGHAWTVRDAMLRNPTIHPADLTIGQALAAFDASAKTHMLLLAHDGVLVSTAIRTDVEGGTDPEALAVDVGSLAQRTIGPDALLAPAHAVMRNRGARRLAVVDDSARLLGLLCLQRGLTGFCTDDGVAEMRRARATERDICSGSAQYQDGGHAVPGGGRPGG
jgi:CBS domain-containing protein